MGQVATVTIAGNNYSVYGLTSAPVTDATTYFGGRLGASATAWNAATADNRARALVTAAGWMDRAVTWSGEPSVDGQPLAWPREGATCNGEAVAGSPSVPDAVVYAEFELAGLILRDAAIAEGSGTGSNVRRAKAGSAEVEFFTPTIGSASDTRLPQVAHDLVKCLFGSVGDIGAPYVSGTDVCSDFDDDDYERVNGFA